MGMREPIAHHRHMPTAAAARLLLFADGPRAPEASTATKVRRYRLARLQLDAVRRGPAEPRYAYLKRTHD